MQMTRNNDRAPDTYDEGWTIPVDPASPGLGRRTLLAGAAWSAPVIAMAIATPLAAASGAQPDLVFLDGPFGASICNTLADIVLQATTDGSTLAANALVTVSLPEGLTWSDGTSGARVLQADAAGQVVLSGLMAPSVAGSYDITATYGSVVTSTSVQISATSTAQFFRANRGTTGLRPNIPAGSVPAGYDTWLAPNGDLYSGQPAVVVASGVTSAVSQYNGASNVWHVFYTDATGAKYRTMDPRTPIPSAPVTRSVPAGSVATGYDTWLAPNGDLYYGATRIATGVDTAYTEYNDGNGITYVFYSGPGGTKFWRSSSSTTVARNVPVGSTAIGYDTWLAPNGDLYFAETRIASGVTSAQSAHRTDNGEVYVFYVDGAGGKFYRSASASTGTRPAIPANSTAVGYDLWLTPNGDLYRGTKKIATNVDETYYELNPQNGIEYIFYNTAPSC